MNVILIHPSLCPSCEVLFKVIAGRSVLSVNSSKKIELSFGLHLVCHIDNDLEGSVSIRIHKVLFLIQEDTVQLKIRKMTKWNIEATNCVNFS